MFPGWIKFKIPAGTDILVNATSIGLYPNINDKPNIDYETITKGMYVQDVIPNPAFTPFLQEADRTAECAGRAACKC